METTPWLTNAGKPAMSPQEERRKTSTQNTLLTHEERHGATGEGKQPMSKSPHA